MRGRAVAIGDYIQSGDRVLRQKRDRRCEPARFEFVDGAFAVDVAGRNDDLPSVICRSGRALDQLLHAVVASDYLMRSVREARDAAQQVAGAIDPCVRSDAR